MKYKKPQVFTKTKMLKVLKANSLCSIQDLGRPQYQHLGFSASGAADEYAFLTANQLLDNDSNAATLEITLGQLVLAAECNCTIAITGANCRAELNNKPIDNWQVHQLTSGDVLSFSQPRQGLHTYFAVKDGIQSPVWLGSRSQTKNESGLCLISDQVQIVKNSELPLSDVCFDPTLISASSPTRGNKNHSNFYPADLLTLRFIPHKLWHTLTLQQQQNFLALTYQITPQSSRMGYRLSAVDEKKEKHSNVTPVSKTEKILPHTINLSKAVTFGSIQLPDFHQPIILMKERQTIGGYPVIGAVMQTDLFRLSQKRPGELIRFIPISQPRAQQQLLAFYQKFDATKS